MLWLQLAIKEIRNNFKFSIFFVLNLGIGLIGFIALDSFKSSIDQHLENNSKSSNITIPTNRAIMVSKITTKRALVAKSSFGER